MIEEFEATIGYMFKEKQRLKQALTHSSYANEHGLSHDYERLEFLGDAVLELLVSDMLFKKFPDMSEGDLTKKRASMVCEPSLAKIARDLQLGVYMLLGHGEEHTGGRERDSILSDALEAVIGAVYIDGGVTAARKLVGLCMRGLMAEEIRGFIKSDYKSRLQEVLQRSSAEPLIYEIIDEHGPDHQKLFKAQVRHCGQVLGVGQGRTKKEAEQQAALCAMEKYQ